MKKKIEFSKAACAISSGLFMLFGAWMVMRYYSLVKLAIENNSSSLPDAALPIAGVTFVFSPLLSYLLYQWGLKNSRNKYGVDANGQPFKNNGGDNQ
jgi:TRAP-type C4-dicarboxylate transport system permease small subunit